MSRFLALSIVAIFATVANAQSDGDASSQRSPILNSKPQLRAEKQKDARPAGRVKSAGGDELATPEGDNIGSGSSAATAQKRVETRETRYPNRKPPQQGGTPDLPGAK